MKDYIPATNTSHFVHKATVGNSAYNYTLVDHPLTNENPNAIAFVTQSWNPGGGIDGTYNDHEIGVWYDDYSNRWSIFNQDYTSTMPISATFNVLIPNVDAGVFVHRATIGTISFNYTNIDHPLTNGYPDAIAFVTQNWNPGGGGGIYNDHPIGVWYNAGAGKWSIFNQDGASMPISATFNVLIPISDTTVFVHEATAGTIADNSTYVDHPLANNNPHALVFVTQNWNPGGGSGIYNNRSIGVWYDDKEGKWAIFNQDMADMPEGAAFNVLVKASKVYLPLVIR